MRRAALKPTQDKYVCVDNVYLGSCCIENNMRVAEFLANPAVLPLLANKTADMTRAFGKNPASYRGEFMYRIWPFRFKGQRFFVLTSKRGTSIEVCVAENNGLERYANSERRGKIAIEFVKAIQDALVPY